MKNTQNPNEVGVALPQPSAIALAVTAIISLSGCTASNTTGPPYPSWFDPAIPGKSHKFFLCHDWDEKSPLKQNAAAQASPPTINSTDTTK